jgi:hypothetical protein
MSCGCGLGKAPKKASSKAISVANAALSHCEATTRRGTCACVAEALRPGSKLDTTIDAIRRTTPAGRARMKAAARRYLREAAAEIDCGRR